MAKLYLCNNGVLSFIENFCLATCNLYGHGIHRSKGWTMEFWGGEGWIIVIGMTFLTMVSLKIRSHGTKFKNKGRFRWAGRSCIVLEVPMHNLLTSICDFVPYDRIVQRAHFMHCEIRNFVCLIFFLFVTCFLGHWICHGFFFTSDWSCHVMSCMLAAWIVFCQNHPLPSASKNLMVYPSSCINYSELFENEKCIVVISI